MGQGRSERNAGGRFLLLGACAVVIAHGLQWGAPILVPFALAGFTAVLSFPIVYYLRRHRVPSFLAVLVAVLVIVGAGGLLIYLALESATEFVKALPRYIRQLDVLRLEGLAWLQDHGVAVRELVVVAPIDAGAVVGFARGLIQQSLSFFSNAFLVLLYLVFMLAEATSIPDKLRLMLGGGEEGMGRFSRITREVLQYLVIKTIVSAATGVLVGVGVWAVGLDFPILWGLVAFLLNYIPTIGSIVASIPPVALGLLQLGPGAAVGIAGIYLAVNMTLGNFIEPMLLGRRLGLSTLVVVLSLIFWGWVWGPVGMLLAVPLTMVVKILLQHTRDLGWVAVLLAKWPLDQAFLRKFERDAASGAPADREDEPASRRGEGEDDPDEISLGEEEGAGG